MKLQQELRLLSALTVIKLMESLSMPHTSKLWELPYMVSVQDNQTKSLALLPSVFNK